MKIDGDVFRYVVIVVEAFDILLVTCHSQSLNLFVESFLKMVQKLLECSEPDMQCLAVDSVSCVIFLVKFSARAKFLLLGISSVSPVAQPTGGGRSGLSPKPQEFSVTNRKNFKCQV